jgi:hypothetical protein
MTPFVTVQWSLARLGSTMRQTFEVYAHSVTLISKVPFFTELAAWDPWQSEARSS